MQALADRPVRELLDRVASRTPAPGGGSSAALACALAAGLVEMTAAFTSARPEHAGRAPRMAELAARAQALRTTAAALAERELGAFAPVLDALRLPTEDPARPARVDAALSEAAESPLAIARAAAEVAELACAAVRDGTAHLVGDARAGVLLADGACQAAAGLAAINLARRPDDARHAELADLAARAARARAEVLAA
ncbi:MAG TPA: cyclodeaminase/cyclohydrolase family protein [Conexibacter sp.]|nr:cyclodeaminase/cyclohydrolase family protein [Conexibacter sp.]